MGLRDILLGRQRAEQFQETEAQQLDKAVVKARNLLKEVAATRSPDFEDSLISLYNPNVFMSRKGFHTIDEMLRDEQIFGILEFRKNFILSTGWDIVIPKDIEEGEQAKAEEFQQFIMDNFQNKYVGLLNRDIYQVLSAFEYGFSISEKVFMKIDNQILLKRIKTVPPHSIEFNTDSMGKLSEIQQTQENGDVSLPVKKMILYTNRDKFDQPYGVSDLERCHRAWFAKDITVKLWGVYLQRFASPFPVGKVRDGADANEVSSMRQVLDYIQQAVSLVIPESSEIELHKVGTSSSGEYDRAIERFNQMIGRGLLLPDLMGFGQSTKGGSFALGKTQFKSFVQTAEYDRKKLEDIINEEIIKPLIDMNFGIQEVYPMFKFNPYEDEQLIDYLKLFLEALDKGMPANMDDFNHFRGLIQFPDMLDEDINIEPGPKQEPKPQPTEAPKTENEEVEMAKKKDTLEITVETKTDIKFSRKLNKYEERMDLAKQARVLQSRELNTVDRLADRFEDTLEALKDRVVRKNIIENADYKEIEKTQLKFLGDIRIMLKRDLKEVYSFAFDEANKEIDKLEKTQNFAKISDTRVKSKEAARLADELINARTFQAVGTLKDELLDKSKSAMLNGVEKGASTQEVLQDLDEIFNGVTEGAATAKLAADPGLLSTIVRTNYTNIYNTARRQVAQSPDLGRFIKMFQYSAILDARTTEICERLDGVTLPVDHPDWNRIQPPNHFNCRSLLLYVTEVDVKEDDIKPTPEPNLDSLRKLPGSQTKSGSFI